MKSNKHTAAVYYRAFTLLELLVVLSIISLLFSILLPSLNKVKERGRSVVCMTNLKELGYAWQMYAMTNKEKLVSCSTYLNEPRPWVSVDADVKGRNHWVADGEGIAANPYCGTETALKKGALWPYLEQPKVYHCKSHIIGLNRSYSMAPMLSPTVICSCKYPYRKMTEIDTSAQTLVLIDSTVVYETPDHSTFRYQVDYNGFEAVHLDNRAWNNVSLMTSRHNNACNMVFADLHTEHYRWQDKKTIDMIQGLCTSEDDYNADLEYLLRICRGRRH